MSRTFLLIILVAGWANLTGGVRPIFGQQINWRHNYDVARQEAKQKNLPMLIDFSTKNCVWCRKLEASTFRDPVVEQILRTRYIPVKVDGDKYYHLVKKLGIQSYPTLILAAPNGKILDVHEGYILAEPFRQKLQGVLTVVQANFPNQPISNAPNSFTPPQDSIQLTSGTQPADKAPMDRRQIAQRLLALAQEEYSTQQFLSCLTRCKVLAATFPDLPEGQMAQKIAAKVKSNPEHVHLACERLTDTLCELYLTLADHALKDNQPEEAIPYLQWIVRVCPQAPYAETARNRLKQIQN